MYRIEYAVQAVEDLRYFKRHEQVYIVDGIQAQLTYEPTLETRNRKLTRPNSIATWELRLGDFRVFYDVDDGVQVVAIQRIAQKRRNLFLFRGQQEDV